MYAAYWYLAATAAVVGLAWFRGPVNRDCGLALAVWFVLAQLGYDRGEVEWIQTYIIAGIQFLIVGYLVGKHDRHWLTLWLLATNAGRLLWNAYYGTDPDADPWMFKSVKNLIFISELLALLASSTWINRTRKN